MKKILCLIDGLTIGGGAERQMIGLVAMLHQDGYDVTLASYYKHNSDEYLINTYQFASVLIPTSSNKLSKLVAVHNFIKNNGFDIVIAYKDGPTIIGCISKILGGKFKLVVSERNTTQSLNKHDKIKFFFYRWADLIVPNSQTQGVYLGKHFPLLKSKISVITNFTDTELFKPFDNLSNTTNVINILIVARLAYQKNTLRFLNVVNRLRDNFSNIHIKWIGRASYGEDCYAQEVKTKYDELALGDTLEFLNATHEISKAYQNCDVFCLPSLFEGYPNALCEAMSCGKPVVASRVSDVPYIVEEGVNGFLFDPLDENDMYNQIVKVCSMSREQLEQMGRINRKYAIEYFSKDSFINKYKKIIDD